MPASRALPSRTTRFHQLHERGCFVMPNPWDPGTARAFAQMGFPALATTSAGAAWSLGLADNAVDLETMLAHLATMAAAVGVPVNADFEGGFAIAPEDVAVNVTRGCATGVAGLSIEDSTGHASSPLLDRELAVERIHAARAAIDDTGTGVLLTARSEGFFVGRPDLDETIARLVAFARAGADCVYAPGVRDRDQIRAIVDAVRPTPVNLLASGPFITVEEAAAIGVRRISVGGALARVAWAGTLAAAAEIAEHGTFGTLATGTPSSDLNRRFGGA